MTSTETRRNEHIEASVFGGRGGARLCGWLHCPLLCGGSTAGGVRHAGCECEGHEVQSDDLRPLYRAFRQSGVRGLFWPKHRLSDEDGFRKDVIEALREIKVPIVRWPGGCYVSDYHWKCGVGPNRQPMWNKAWAVEDSNTFGTDEYVKWCRKVGCEPYICTNAGTGDEEEMSDWVEYCNLNVGKWGRQRIANGYEKPHDVMYWSIGAENRVKPMKTVFEVKDGKVLLPPHSLTCLELVGCGSVRPECR